MKNRIRPKAADTARALSRSLAGARRSFSEGTDRVADAVVAAKSSQAKAFKEETVRTFKDIGRGLKRDLKGVRPGDVVCSASYGMGRLTRTLKIKLENLVYARRCS